MLTPIHNCLQANLENEYYKEKLTEFYKENKYLKEKLKDFQNQNDQLKQLTTKHRLSREVCTQTTTESKAAQPSEKGCCSVCDRKASKTSNQITSKDDNDSFNKQNKKSYVKLCEMQHSLLKKYENEVNSNAVKQDLINHMKLELDSLESAKNNVEQENIELRQRLETFQDLEVKHKTLVLDYESCRLKCKKYKNELKCFDKSFFDELEELKKNYEDSIKLNKHYENLLYELNRQNLIIVDKRKNAKKEVKFAIDSDLDEDEDGQVSECLKSFSSDLSQILNDSDSKNTDDSIDVDNFLLSNEKPQTDKDNESDLDETLDYQHLIDQLATD